MLVSGIVRGVLDDSNSHFLGLIFLVAPGGVYDKGGHFEVAQSLANKGEKYQQVTGLQMWYNDTLSSGGMRRVFVHSLDAEVKSYSAAFENALSEFVTFRCSSSK